MTNQCLCCSGKNYEQCCKPLHEGALPANALQLMRSRYTAYALNLPLYIIHTTHPASPQYQTNPLIWAQEISEFSKHSKFQRLDIHSFQEHGDLATVTFTAHLTQGRKEGSYTEKSLFEKTKGRWLYRSGQLINGHAPNLATTSTARVLPIAYYGDLILTKKADPISEITPSLRKLVEEMIETMDACNGVGLAAPQVHHSIRLFIIRAPIEHRDGSLDYGDVCVFINPKISNESKQVSKATEGCLSIPTIHGKVNRPKQICIEYTNLEGQQMKEICNGWKARMILHEHDHIDGILFIDRMDPKEREQIEPQLKQIYHRIHDGTEL